MATDVKTTATRTQAAAGPNSGHRPYLFTAEQVLKMVEAEILPEDTSTELLNGVLYQVTKGELHNAIVCKLAELVRVHCPVNFHVREDKSNRAGERSLPEPDVALCAGGIFDYLPDVAPLGKLALVAEVSHSSRDSDRVIKFAMYAAAGVPCYWIVNVRARNVEVWTRPAEAEDGTARYQSLATHRPGESIPVVIDGQARGEVNVAEIFPPEKLS